MTKQGSPMLTLDQLPLELIATILSYLELSSLIHVISVCKLLANVCKDPLLNPWRTPIQRALTNYNLGAEDDDEWLTNDSRILEHLSCYFGIPKNNWIDILATAPACFILFHEIPWLPDQSWQEAFMRRFLPSWARWKKDQPWKQTFLMILWRVWHRLSATCTADESWTNFIILSRQGIVNSTSASSRQYNPHAVLNIYKEQNNLRNYPTTTRLIVQLADVRIIVMGTLGNASSFQVNKLAKEFIHPAGVYPTGVGRYLAAQVIDDLAELSPQSATSDISGYSNYNAPRVSTPLTRSLTMDSTLPSATSIWRRFRSGTYSTQGRPAYPESTQLDFNAPLVPLITSSSLRMSSQPIQFKNYSRVTHPQPIDGHKNYPNYTPGGQDRRWPSSYDGTEEEYWIGPMLVTALLVPGEDKPIIEGNDDSEDELLRRVGSGRNRWASFTADDLDAIAPWLSEYVDKKMEGMGLGI